MERLRRASFPVEWPNDNSKDQFDDLSSFITAFAEGELCGVLRCTPHSAGLGKSLDCRLPAFDGSNVWYGSRLCVRRGFQLLAYLLICEALIWTALINVDTVCATAEDSNPFFPFYEAIGFEAFDIPQMIRSYPGEPGMAQVLQINPRAKLQWILAAKHVYSNKRGMILEDVYRGSPEGHWDLHECNAFRSRLFSFRKQRKGASVGNLPEC